MRKILVVAALFLGALSGQAQEKVMKVIKKDGSSAQTRVVDLKQISFLTVAEGGQGLLIKTVGGETAAVLFEAHPIVTVSDSKLVVKSNSSEAVEFEISDIEEIQFGDASDEATTINVPEGFAYVLQDSGALLRGLPKGVKPRVYSIDGRSLPTPRIRNGELRLSRATMGPGIFIVKVGSFSTKIKL